MSRYAIHRAVIESSGLRLGEEPCAETDDIREALKLAAVPENQGPEGAAIVCADGRVVYSSDEYRAFATEAAS